MIEIFTKKLNSKINKMKFISRNNLNEKQKKKNAFNQSEIRFFFLF